MNKTELIESIRAINKSATPQFLVSFSVEELRAYLNHLLEVHAAKELVAAH